MVEEKEEKGFKISDKRIFSSEARESEQRPEEKEQEVKNETGPAEEESQRTPLPEVNFTTFIFSLSHSALTHFGEIPDPVTKSKKKDLAMAKQTIDIISMLKEKTTGNLTKEEQELIDHILYDLRMRYVKEVNP